MQAVRYNVYDLQALREHCRMSHLMAGLHLYLLLYFCYRHVLNYYYLLVITVHHSVGLIYTAFDHTNYRDVQIYLKGFI